MAGKKEIDSVFDTLLRGLGVAVAAGATSATGLKLAGILADLLSACRQLHECTHDDSVDAGRLRMCLRCGATCDVHEGAADWSRPALVEALVRAWGRT
jgi:hypothetical protein